MEFIPAGWVENDGDQNMTWDMVYYDPYPVGAILVDNDYYFNISASDLVVEDTKIERLNGSCSSQTPTEFVECHSYDVDALIKNRGGYNTTEAFNVSLYDNTTRIDTVRVNSLNSSESKWVRFQWQPTIAGDHILGAMADSDHEVNNELSETNNNLIQTETVLPAGAPDLDASSCMDFSPAWMSDATDIRVTVLNNGTGDAGNFTVNVTMTSDCADPNYPWTNSATTSMCAKAYSDITFTTPPLLHCCNYTVTARLDREGNVTESDEANNNETKVFHAIPVKLKVTHHYGNWSTYNGVLSDNNPVYMFELHKNVTNYTTPYKLLTSEADVTSGYFTPPYVYGINRSCAATPGTSTWHLNQSVYEYETCPIGSIHWHCFINGIPIPDMPHPMDDYTIRDGDVMHMDLLKYVNSGCLITTYNYFIPRPLDFPEPFLHGYNGTVWNTTIVYPSNDPGGDYAVIAGDIRDNLVYNYTIPAGRIHIHANATVGNRKNTDNLILIGTPLENHLIAEINANHTEVGMPMYFMDQPNNVVWLIDDLLYNDDDPNVPDCCSLQNSSYHSVVMACGNPFDNAEPWIDTWMDANKSVWIASGVTPCYAKDAASMLAAG
ncbi:MAG: hypothetical protein C4B59_16515 [Candidatus Methanogaster sp.]|uniref:Uncharacterized protein n=1 Tax=Candidatus Methanogaster sp. TaxID=3386292 RepID=A0AC61KY45_9EURY|nr:MAG: hypothetical protein C4B59_16515 [ANME-2 cluster archaeon]